MEKFSSLDALKNCQRALRRMLKALMLANQKVKKLFFVILNLMIVKNAVTTGLPRHMHNLFIIVAVAISKLKLKTTIALQLLKLILKALNAEEKA